ncbi:MAG: 3-phosphoshikimate 1-carboxyvinyltransferase, partial [Armatimonadota bacterium]
RDRAAGAFTVHGHGGAVPADQAELMVGNSGTTARFITPLVALGSGTFIVDGVARMRQRPIGDLVEALESLGVAVTAADDNRHPPVRIEAAGLPGGQCRIRADASSQFLSGLLLSAPVARGDETIIHLEGPILSAPYIRMTVEMVRAFGGRVDVSDDERTYRVPGRQTLKSPGTYAVEPDASAASYFWAVAALTGGTVRIPGLGPDSLQGDVGFVDVLEQMGCTIDRDPAGIAVAGPARLRGVDLDMNAISDTVMTLAAIAPFADDPTTIRNVGHIRHKETDRLHAVRTELTRMGVVVEESLDALVIHPCRHPRSARIRTYDDHRMAMAFAVAGLRAAGLWIEDPDCVAKTFPDYFPTFDRLVHGHAA